MKKKVKDLSIKEVYSICKKYSTIECHSECPLYRRKDGEVRLCSLYQGSELGELPKYKELRELEVDIEKNRE